MIDAAGVERDADMPYCKAFHKDETGCYALVYTAQHVPDVWRFRSGGPQFITIERHPHEHETIESFREMVMGATRPSRAQFRFQAVEAEASWTKHLKAQEPEKAGYDPTVKRQTCPKHGLTWHENGECRECDV